MFLDQAVRPEYPVRSRWEPGSVAFCDNRAAIHLAPGETARLGSPRITHRVMPSGDVPVGADGRPCEPLTGSAPDAGEAGRGWRTGPPVTHVPPAGAAQTAAVSGMTTSSSTGGSTSCARLPVAAKQRSRTSSGVTSSRRNDLKNGGL